MDEVIKDLLLNLLFLLFFLIFIPLLLEQSNVREKYKKTIICASSCLAIVACISFPLVVNEDIIFDLRVVAAITGGLYGGLYTNIFLWLTTIIYRSLLGGEGIFTA